MKGLNLFLAACFVVPMLNGAMADSAKNTTRTPSTRGQQTSTTNTRNSDSVKQRANTQNTVTTARTTTSSKNVIKRNSTDKSRSAAPTRETSVVARTAKKQPTTARTAKQTSTKLISRKGLSRSATPLTRESVMQRDFGKCRSVFFECMDEFCANKDAQLKRCACSSRNTEFVATQKSLDKVEDKLLDFSQHLLKVNMDPADAAVINQETEGEKAYNETKDKTASKKALDEIAKKLNTSFDSAENNMSALSWTLNVDAAFDSVDSLSGTSTTAKNGLGLRNAALPICREVAAEVCSDYDISLVENSYNMAIEQDCNTVKKAYETQTQQARTKVLEGSALLDMTRLNNYQDNNSDDILTCKSKMLNMLSNTNVCVENLTKCLDISGRYINPTTGEAFLSADLINISKLIVRPTNSDSWARTPANAQFVSYLNSKKKYLESATKNCQVIADDVWDVFVEDALAQIKLAQNAKLEEVRQSCTTLLAECLEKANDSLANFDSRALSTFGVATDKTANALCENVKTSCSAVMEYIPDDENATITADTDWSQGVTDIAAMESYTKIINTCREIGRDCIINSCKSITGNFGLCESIHGSVNRHSILARSACWNQVVNCVAQASDETIKNIRHILPNYGTTPQALYEHTYIIDGDDPVYDVCRQAAPYACSQTTQTGGDPDNVDCYRCRITEQIWGNCRLIPNNIETNHILIPTDPNTTTLLSWFAKNTHTQDNNDSCAVSICPAGQVEVTIDTNVICMDPESIITCGNNSILCSTKITTPNSSIKNCCPGGDGYIDNWGNCCTQGISTEGISELSTGLLDATVTASTKICTNAGSISKPTLLTAYQYQNKTTYIFCNSVVADITGSAAAQIGCPGGYTILECDGTNNTNSFNSNCRYITPVWENAYTYANDYSVNYFINVNADTSNSAPYCASQQSTSPDAQICSLVDNSGLSWSAPNNNTTCPTFDNSGAWFIELKPSNNL